MSEMPKQETREAIFQDLVALHQSITGGAPTEPSDPAAEHTQSTSTSELDVELRASLFVAHFPLGVLFAKITRDRYRHPVNYQVFGVNKRYADLVGVARVSILESAFFDVLPGGRADWAKELESVALKGRSARGVSLAPHTNQQLNVLAFLSNRDTLAVVIDATDTAVGTFRESALTTFQHTETLLQSASLLVCRSLPGGKLIYANQAYQQFFDGAIKSLTAPSYMKSIPADDVDFVRSRVELIRRDHPVVSYEAAYDFADGRRWVQWNEEGTFDPEDKLVAYQAVGTEITAFRKQQQEMRHVGGMMRDLLDFQSSRNREHDMARSETNQTGESLAVENSKLARQLKAIEDQSITGDLAVCNSCSRIHDEHGHWMLPHVFLDLKTSATVASMVCPYCKSKAKRESGEDGQVRDDTGASKEK